MTYILLCIGIFCLILTFTHRADGKKNISFLVIGLMLTIPTGLSVGLGLTLFILDESSLTDDRLAERLSPATLAQTEFPRDYIFKMMRDCIAQKNWRFDQF